MFHINAPRFHPRAKNDLWSARVPFGIAAIGGGLLLIILKTTGINQIFVTLMAIVVIAAYGLTVYNTRSLRLQEDQLGDNCYYLGFLFTLSSLAFALYEFSSSADVDLIVANFGLALGSTIAGILARVMLNQSRKDIIETEVDTRMMLAEATIRLRIQIDDAVSALDAFCRNTRQITSEHMQEAANSTSALLENSISKVGDTSNEVLKKIEEAFTDFKEHSSQLNQNSAATVKAIKGLLTKIENIQAPDDLLLQRISPAIDAVDQASMQLKNRLNDDHNIMSQFSDRNKVIESKLLSFTDGIEAAKEATQNITIGFKNILDELEMVSSQIKIANEQNAVSINRSSAITENSLEAVNDLTERLNTEGQNLVSQINHTKSVLVKLEQNIEASAVSEINKVA